MSSLRRKTGGSAVTIEQVAALAGVHPMTVSRAMQGSQKVAPATRERIEAAARELNYVPNTAARALAMGKTGTIAVVVGSVNEHYYGNVLHLLEMELAKSDYKLLFFRSRDMNRDLLSAIRANAVDGIIAVDALGCIQELVESRHELLPPRVYAGVGIHHWAIDSSDAVEVDLGPGVTQALHSMLESGCRRVAYLIPKGLNPFHDDRLSTYLKVLSGANRQPEFINLEIGSTVFTHEMVRTRLTAYLHARGCPDGLFCHNDEIAIAAFRALRDLNFRVPEDVQLVGCDGIPYMAYMDPPLSTVVQPAEEMCALACQFLEQRIADTDRPQQKVTLVAQLARRASLKADSS